LKSSSFMSLTGERPKDQLLHGSGRALNASQKSNSPCEKGKKKTGSCVKVDLERTGSPDPVTFSAHGAVTPQKTSIFQPFFFFSKTDLQSVFIHSFNIPSQRSQACILKNINKHYHSKVWGHEMSSFFKALFLSIKITLN